MNKPEPENSSPPIQTETMAQLLLNQRHWREAIGIYQQLGRQTPNKKAEYQKKIIEIREYFKPQISPETARKTRHTRQKLNHLKKLLKMVVKQ